MTTSTLIRFGLVMAYAVINVSCYFEDGCSIPDHAWCDQNQAYNCIRPKSEYPEPFIFTVNDCSKLNQQCVMIETRLSRSEKYITNYYSTCASLTQCFEPEAYQCQSDINQPDQKLLYQCSKVTESFLPDVPLEVPVDHEYILKLIGPCQACTQATDCQMEEELCVDGLCVPNQSELRAP